MNNQQQFDAMDSENAAQQTTEDVGLHPLQGVDQARQAPDSDRSGSDQTGDHRKQFGAINSLNPEENGPKARNAADEDLYGADIEAAHDPNGAHTLVRKDSADVARGPFTQQQANEGGDANQNGNPGPAHDLTYQPDQYGSARGETEQHIDASLDDYARRFPGGQQAAQHAKEEIAGVLDDFEQRAADGVADHDGQEGVQ